MKNYEIKVSWAGLELGTYEIEAESFDEALATAYTMAANDHLEAKVVRKGE